MTFQAIIIFFALAHVKYFTPFFLPHFYCLRIQQSLLTRSSTRRLRRFARNVPCAEKRGKTAAYVMGIVDGDDIVIYFTNLCTSEIARV